MALLIGHAGYWNMTDTTEPHLSSRAEALFSRLVKRYIDDGQPVGSRTLSRDAGVNLSPATVRNVMADLEEAGLLCSPHTSAGRIPTVRGYRFFVDTLLTVNPLAEHEVKNLEEQFNTVSDSENLSETVSSLLAELTSMAGVVMLPKHDVGCLRHIEFLSLSGNRVLVITVMNKSNVQNRVIYTKRHYSESELQEAANYLNRISVGHDLREIRGQMLHELDDTREHMNEMMRDAIELARQIFSQPTEDDFVSTGQQNLMEYVELANIDKIRELFSAFNKKNDILQLLDLCLGASGVQIFIGEESGYDALNSCSVVTAPYEANGEALGVLGVIGPTRMAYDRIIPIVDVTARLFGSVLNNRQ